MAKDKSKDEVKADILEEETKNVTIETVKHDDPEAAKKIDKGGKISAAKEELSNGSYQKDNQTQNLATRRYYLTLFLL